MHEVSKAFSGVRANDRVDFDLRSGEIHALLGENGAGKTTLMNILAGLERPDAGEILLRGRPVGLGSPRQAIEHGIGMVHQHFKLVSRFTVAENVTLGWHSPRMLIRRRALESEIGKLAESYGIDVDPGRPVWQLSIGEQQRVEILKSLYRGAEILVLDEPTAVLTPQEAAGLFESLRRMRDESRGIVLITHRLDEVMATADRVTVLRGGRRVATTERSATSNAELARLMIGADLAGTATRAGTRAGDVILSVQGIAARDDRGAQALHGIDLEVREGEVLGLAGVAGNGQRQLAEVVVGLRKPTAGHVVLQGRDVTEWSVGRRFRAGIGYVPEDRIGEGVAPSLSILDNLLSKGYRDPPVGGRFFIHTGAGRRVAAELVRRYDIRGADLDAPAGALSGGNLQKLLLARELSANPKLLVASQPTRGLDVGAAQAMRELLREQRDAGRAVFVIGEDLEELVALSDRIAVIHRGRITGTFPAHEVDEEELGLLMAGRAP